jgi:hypothetical protein
VSRGLRLDFATVTEAGGVPPVQDDAATVAEAIKVIVAAAQPAEARGWSKSTARRARQLHQLVRRGDLALAVLAAWNLAAAWSDEHAQQIVEGIRAGYKARRNAGKGGRNPAANYRAIIDAMRSEQKPVRGSVDRRTGRTTEVGQVARWEFAGVGKAAAIRELAQRAGCSLDTARRQVMRQA